MTKINDEFKQQVAIEARFSHTYRDILIKLDVPINEWPYLLNEFENPDSELSRYYRKGQLAAEEEIITGLQKMIDNEADGAGDAAYSLNKMRHNKIHESLKHELFGL